MTRVSIDDQISEIGRDPSKMKIGEILEAVIAALPPNRIITEINLDGRELSKFGGRGALDQNLAEIRNLQIRTNDKEIWTANGLDTALSCVERVQKSLIRAAELFRDENRKEGNKFFVRCVDGLERFIEVLMITRAALQLDFSHILVEGRVLSEIENEFSTVLKTIIHCQENEDFVGLADKVEYELLTNLSWWAKALKQLRATSLSNA